MLCRATALCHHKRSNRIPRRSIGVLVAVALSLFVPTVAAAKTKTIHVKSTLIGAQVSSNENVYRRARFGPWSRGSVHQENAAGTGGSYTGTAYFGIGTLVSAGTFTNSAPDSNGIVTINGSGRWVRGTGLYKHIRGKFTVSGTLNTKSGQLKIVLVGTETY